MNTNDTFKVRNSKCSVHRARLLLTGIIIIIAINIMVPAITAADESKWSGVDETVVEKYAEEHGRKARDPIINTDQGDLLLFVFLLAGAVGGFIMGYYWKSLVDFKRTDAEQTPSDLQ